jgi:hypothetical protein
MTAVGEYLYIAGLGILGVFLGLLLLTLVLSITKRLFIRIAGRNAEGCPDPDDGEAPTVCAPPNNEVVAAIASAIFLDLRSFDLEKEARLTITKVTKPFSPWKHGQNIDLVSQQQQLQNRSGSWRKQ